MRTVPFPRGENSSRLCLHGFFRCAIELRELPMMTPREADNRPYRHPECQATAELMRTAVENDACTGCHDTADLADRTRDSIALVDSNQTTMNPHALPENKGHSKIGCTDCHTAHESTDVLERAPQACQNCHHADIYDCETCH